MGEEEIVSEKDTSTRVPPPPLEKLNLPCDDEECGEEAPDSPSPNLLSPPKYLDRQLNYQDGPMHDLDVHSVLTKLRGGRMLDSL